MTPPHDLDAERAVLGALMLGAVSTDEAEIYAQLEPESFYAARHGAVYAACRSLHEEQVEVDLVSVVARLRALGDLEKAGGATEVAKLDAPGTTNLIHYARIVHELAMRRRLINAAAVAASKASDLELPVYEAIDQVAENISQIVTSGARNEPKSMSLLVREEFRLMQAASEAEHEDLGVATGFYALDQKLGGMRGSELILLAGRPSMGKTALALAIARNVATKSEETALVISLEMGDRALVQRELAAVANVDSQRVRRPKKLDADEWSRIADAAGRLDTRKLLVLDAPKLSVLDIRAQARLVRARHGLGLIVVDYIGLVRPVRREQMREREVSEISAGLKALSKELAVPVLCLSQLNRAVEARASKEKRPRLSDLRESGSLEQDADVVLFVHRDGYYDPHADQGVAEVIVAKQRNGPTGIVEVGWNARCVRFFNLEMFHNEQR